MVTKLKTSAFVCIELKPNFKSMGVLTSRSEAAHLALLVFFYAMAAPFNASETTQGKRGGVGPEIEGTVFNSIIRKMDPKKNPHVFSLLGGWTQVGTKVTPLRRLCLEQDRRMMSGLCLSCGSDDHVAESCSSPDNSCVYVCSHCSGKIKVNAAGFSSGVAPSEPALRPSEPLPVANPVVDAPCTPFLMVGVVAFTHLSWFFGGNVHWTRRTLAANYEVKSKGEVIQVVSGNIVTLGGFKLQQSRLPTVKDIRSGRVAHLKWRSPHTDEPPN